MENIGGKTKLITLMTDNGGEYSSNKFEEYLRSEGIQCEEQNSVAEYTFIEPA